MAATRADAVGAWTRPAAAALALLAAWALTLANTLVTFEPELLPADARGFVDPSVEFGPANAVSAGLFAVLAAAAGWNAAAAARGSRPRRARVLRWAGLGTLGALLAVDELTDLHLRLLSQTYLDQVGPELGFVRGYAVWAVLAAPLALALAALFVWSVRRELADRPALRRAAWASGFLWITVLVHEALAEPLFATRAPALENLLEESAEMLGAAGLAAVSALAFTRHPPRPVALRRRLALAGGAAALGMACLACRAEPPLTDWGATDVWMGPFPSGTGAEQTLALPHGAVSRIDVRAAYRAADGAPGVLALRLRAADEALLREAAVRVPAGAVMAEYAARFAPLAADAGARAHVQAAADPNNSGVFTLSVSSGDAQPSGAVFPNGQPAPAGQDLNVRLYGPRGASLAKLGALARLAARDPLMLVILADALLLAIAAGFVTLTLAPLLHQRAPPT